MSFSLSLFRKKPREKIKKTLEKRKDIRMVDKKGAIHVDWAISMGLFLIYVIMLFILIKPGSYAEHKPESLFTILEGNLNKDLTIDIKEIQFVVEKCAGNSKVTLEDLNGKYHFSELMKEDGTLLNGFAGISVGTKITISCKDPGEYPVNSRQIFLATSYPKEHFNFNDVNSLPRFSVTCDPAGQPNKCSASLGTVTEYNGFNEDYVNQLKTSPYADISNSWGFPIEKRFDITISKIKKNELTNQIEISSKVIPLEGVDVFVKEFNYIYIDKYNNRENIKVHIDVW